MSADPFRLSSRHHASLFLGILVALGGMCPKCGHGTRVTSKRWARCKREECGERVARQDRQDLTSPPG